MISNFFKSQLVREIIIGSLEGQNLKEFMSIKMRLIKSFITWIRLDSGILVAIH